MGSHHEDLLRNAAWLNEQDQVHAALLLAHVAVEVYASYAFLFLFRRAFGELDDAWGHAVPARTFLDRPTQVLWRMLTGGDVVTEPKSVWTPYKAAVEIRNKVAHGAKWPTADEAHASITAVRAFIDQREVLLVPLRAQG